MPRLRDARIRSKLAVILAVPLAAVLVLAIVRVTDSTSRAIDAGLVRSLTKLAADVSALAHDAHQERMAAAKFLAAPSEDGATAYNVQVQRTEDRADQYRAARAALGDVPDTVESRLDRIDEHLSTLDGTRQEVLANQQVSVAESVLRYGVLIGDLVAYGEVIGQIAGQEELADSLRAVSAFSRAKASTAEEQAIAFAALTSGNGLDDEEFSSFVATLTSQQEALLAFSLVAGAEQRALVNSTVTGDAVVLADQASAEVNKSVGKRTRITAADAERAVGAVNDLMRWAEQRLEERVLADAEAARSGVLRQVLVESIIILLILAVAVALAVVVARALVRALSRLREGALTVANHDLPQAVSRLRDVRSLDEGGVEEITRQLGDPIRLGTRDEVGQVAQAFNIVHREAVRIAAEQAALRTSVSAMFLNLARRSQALVDRMIGELDTIERTEEDPKRLAQLFQLDHLATRMRRNDENLLVLAGADSSTPRREDALLVDALRAAQSEVELYNRIEFGTVDSDISIAAHAVNDVVRLVAELLDNATRFSPPNTIVVAEARRIRDYVLIQVEDRGLGLSDAQLDAFNRRLAEPPAVDVAAFRLMGLAVVARLAARYGIRVELRHNSEGGTVAHVSLPTDILILPRFRSREPLVRPLSPLAVEPGPMAGGWPDQTHPAMAGRPGSVATLADPWDAAQRWDSAATEAPPPPLPHRVPATHADPVDPPRAEPVVTAGAKPASGYAAGAPGRAESGELPIFQEMEASWFRSHGAGPVEPWAMPTAGHPPPPPPAAGAMASPVTGSTGGDGFRSTGWAPPPARPVPQAPATTGPPTTGHSDRAYFDMPSAGRPPAYAPPEAPPPSTLPPPPAQSPPPVSTPPGGAVPRPRGTGENGWQTKADEGWRRAFEAAVPSAAGTTRSGLPKRVPQAQLVPGGIESTGRERTRRTPEEVRGLLAAYHRGVQRGRSAGESGNEGLPQPSTKESHE